MPERAAAFVADQLDVDPGRLEEYRTRAQTAYEHAWQIRDTFGYREFAAGEEDLRAYLAARVWASEEDPVPCSTGPCSTCSNTRSCCPA